MRVSSASTTCSSMSCNPISRGRSPPSPAKLGFLTVSRQGSRASLPRPEAQAEDDISRQVAEWDALMDGLDKQQAQVLNDQWRLLRTQIGSLMGAVAEMKHTAERVTDMETFFGKYEDKHKAFEVQQSTMSGMHDELKATMETRLKYLEGVLGESTTKHLNELRSAQNEVQDLRVAVAACAKTEQHHGLEARVEFLEKEIGESVNKHDDHKSSMEERMEFLESKLGDSAEHHWKEIAIAKEKLANLHKAVSQCAKSEHQSSFEKRLVFLEKELGESVDDHHDHKVSIHDCIKCIESNLADNAEKHKNEVRSIEARLRQAISHCAKQEHRSSLETRLAFVEKELGEAVGKHDEHKTSIGDRMQFLESRLGDCAEKHWNEIQAAKTKLGDVHKAMAECAQQSHHSSLEKRIEFIEKEREEAVGKHDEHKTSIDDRMQFLESRLEDSTEKYWNQIQVVKTTLGEAHKAIAECAHQAHHNSLLKRVEFIENELGESVDKHDMHKTSMEDRMEFLETKVGDSAEKHWEHIEAAKTQLGDIHKRVMECAKVDHASSLDKRIDFLEQMIGDNADKHFKDLQDHENGNQEHRESVDTRLEHLETLIGDNSDKYCKEIDAAKKKLGNVEATLIKCASAELHVCLEQRMFRLERDLGVSVEGHGKSKQSVEERLDSLDRKLKECGLSIDSKKHASDIERLEGIVLAGIDKRLSTIEEKHLNDFIKRLNDHEIKHMQDLEQMKSRMRDIDKAMKECADTQHLNGDIDNTLSGLDRNHGILTKQQAEVSRLVKDLMQSTTGQIVDQRHSLENVKASLEQRLDELEGRFGEPWRGKDFLKEMEQRYTHIQEGQKRARDVLESSLRDQIRFEHSAVHSQACQIQEQWDRELKARQAYLENYKDLLRQERKAREAQETQIGSRLDNFERGIYSELQRVWLEFQKEAKDVSPVLKQSRAIVIPPAMSSQVSSACSTPMQGYGVVEPASLIGPSRAASPPLPGRSSPATRSSTPMMRRLSGASLAR